MERKHFIQGFSCVSRSLTEYHVSPRKGFEKYHQVPFGVSKRYFRPILTWQTYGLCSIAAISELKVDLIFCAAHNSLVPVEVKGGLTWNRDFCRNLLKLRKLSPDFAAGYVIYGGDLTPEIDGIKFRNYKDTASIFV